MNKKQAQRFYELQKEGYQLLYTGSYCDGEADEYSDCMLPAWESRPIKCELKKEDWGDDDIEFEFFFYNELFEGIDSNDIPSDDVFARKIIKDCIYGSDINENGDIQTGE